MVPVERRRKADREKKSGGIRDGKRTHVHYDSVEIDPSGKKKLNS